jgi:hypothetical protein
MNTNMSTCQWSTYMNTATTASTGMSTISTGMARRRIRTALRHAHPHYPDIHHRGDHQA